MDKTIKVIATKGLSVPMHNAPREYITDSVTVEVPDNAYYRRAVRDGDLILKTSVKGSK